jgi:hypothetical protein
LEEVVFGGREMILDYSQYNKYKGEDGIVHFVKKK